MADRTVRVVLEGVVSGFRNNMRAAAQTARTEGGRMLQVAEQNRASFTALGLAMGAAGAAITLGLRRAGRENIAFESTLTRSTTLIGIAREEMQEMGDAALRMAHTGQGPIELAEALFFVQSAGLRGQEALDVLEASAMAASIGLGETKVVADLVTSAVNAYGSDVLTAAEATDVLIGTVREGKAEAPELAGALGRLLPIASELGVSFDQVGAATAAMTRTGSDARIASTQLRSILVSMLNPAQQAEQAMTEFGISSSMVRRAIREDGLFAALQMMRDAIGDNEQALGQIFPNQRALLGFLDLTGANAAENAEIFDRLTDSTGLLAEGFDEWSNTSEAAIDRFSAASQSARIALMDGLETPLAAVLDTGTALAEMFVDLPGPVRGTIAIVGGLTGAMLLFGGATLIALTRVNQLRAAMIIAGTQALTFRGVLAGVGRFMMGPWGAALAAATIAVAAFVQHQQAARQRAEEFGRTLDAQTGAVTDASHEWVAYELATRDVAGSNRTTEESARTLGLTMEDLREHLLGNEEATARVNAALEQGDGFWKRMVGRFHDAGGSTSHLQRVLGEMSDDMERARAEAELTDEIMRELNPELAEVADRFELVGDNSVEAAAEMIDAWSEAAAEFGGLNEAFMAAHQEAEEAERKRAEEAAIAAGEAASSWEDFADDVEVSIDRYIEHLSQMVQDQQDWADNMVRLAGEIPDPMFDELARLGPEGAPLVAMLVRAGNDELAEIIDLWPATTAQGTQAMMDAIAEAGPELNAIAAQHGEDIANAVRDEMIANGRSVEEAAEALGFRFSTVFGPYTENYPPIRVIFDERSVETAQQRLARLTRARSVEMHVTTTGNITLPGVPRHATGGLIGGVGGPTEDRNLILASRGEFMMQAAAVDRFGLGFMEAVNSMRLPAMAGGGPVSSVRVPAMAPMPAGSARGVDGAALTPRGDTHVHVTTLNEVYSHRQVMDNLALNGAT